MACQEHRDGRGSSVGPKRQRGEVLELLISAGAATLATPFTSLTLVQGRATHRPKRSSCRACSWHAFLDASFDVGRTDRRVTQTYWVAQTSPDVCVRQAQDRSV